MDLRLYTHFEVFGILKSFKINVKKNKILKNLFCLEIKIYNLGKNR